MTVYVIFSLAAQHNVTYSAMTEIKIWMKYILDDMGYFVLNKPLFSELCTGTVIIGDMSLCCKILDFFLGCILVLC